MDILDNLTKLYNQITPNLVKLELPVKIAGQKLLLYKAGIGGDKEYPRIFPRDSFTSAFLLSDSRFLHDLLIFCSHFQGKKCSTKTCEEPGKILHEWPEFFRYERSTMYSAADTTPLYLIGFWEYYKLTGDIKFIKKYIKNINLAIGYILNHMRAGIFWDDPCFSGADKFALRATYWRDGGFVERENMEVVYPATYSALQAMIAMALRRCDKLPIHLDYNSEFLNIKARQAAKAIFTKMWCRNNPAVLADKKGRVCHFYSDSLNMLYYLKPSDVPKSRLLKIIKQAKNLETKIGYRTDNLRARRFARKTYYLRTIWPWDNAYIALGAIKFKRYDIAKKSLRAVNALIKNKCPFIEFYCYHQGRCKHLGNCVQLWTIGYVKAMYDLSQKYPKLLNTKH